MNGQALDLRYTYDALGNRTQRLLNSAPTTSTANALNQLTSDSSPASLTIPVSGTVSDATLSGVTVNGLAATVTGGTFTADVTLGAGPNTLLARAVDAGGNSTTHQIQATYAPGPSASYTYDANGNRTSRTSNGVTESYTYDFDDRLKTYTSGSTTASYTYNGLGERVRKTVNSVTTTSYLDGPEVALETTGATTTFYLHGPGLDELLSSTTGGVSRYYHQDALGSIVAITGSDGATLASYAYEPFGSLRAQSGSLTNPWTFTGRLLDAESGLLFLRNRYYDSRSGTFLTADPIGIAGGINLYGYVGNNPVNLIDPFGLRVEIGQREVAFGNYHTVIVLTPDDGGPIMTLSANPDHNSNNDTSPFFGTLVATPNLPSETPINLRNLMVVVDPVGRSDKQLIRDIIMSSRNYKNNLPYGPLPRSNDPYYNSNSYVRGVLKNAGMPNPPTLPGERPGWDKPIPQDNKKK